MTSPFAAPPVHLPTDAPTPRSVTVARAAGVVETVALLGVAAAVFALSRGTLSDGSDPHADSAELARFIWAVIGWAVAVVAVGVAVATASLRRHRPWARTGFLVFQASAIAVGLYGLSGAIGGVSHHPGTLSLYPPLVGGLVAVAAAVTGVVAVERRSCVRYCAVR